MKRRERLTASFNLEEDHEKEMYEFALKQGNVSKYLKRLIMFNMLGNRESTLALHEVEAVEEMDDMSSFI